ncbi:MAG: PucR family transcriptional regulator [Dermatophilaceae bacterium]
MVEVANDAGTSAQTLPAGAAIPPSRADAAARASSGRSGAAEQVARLTALVEHQAALLQREDEVHRVLVRVVLTGGSLAELCDAVAGFLGGTAMVTTTDGRVLAMAGAEAELDRTRGLGCFDRTGRLMVEAEPVGAREALGAADRTRAFVRIVAGASDHGLLGAFCPDRPLTATDVHLLERAATVAALAITKEQAVQAVEGKYRAEFLRDALSGRAGSPSETVAHASSLGWRLDRPLAVVVAETDENDAETTRTADEVRALQDRFVRAWVQAVRTRDATVPVAGFSQEVVCLFPVAAQADPDAVLRAVGEVVREVRGDGGGGRRSFTTGVSRTITSVADLPRAYEEALTSVRVGRRVDGGSTLTHVDLLGIHRLLALVPDTADLRRFVDEALGELATDDAPEHADLRHTLEVLLDTNLNVAETSRRLFFHYNTLRYRIAKLERMVGPFTTDPELRLTLALALRIHGMRGT